MRCTIVQRKYLLAVTRCDIRACDNRKKKAGRHAVRGMVFAKVGSSDNSPCHVHGLPAHGARVVRQAQYGNAT